MAENDRYPFNAADPHAVGEHPSDAERDRGKPAPGTGLDRRQERNSAKTDEAARDPAAPGDKPDSQNP